MAARPRRPRWLGAISLVGACLLAACSIGPFGPAESSPPVPSGGASSPVTPADASGAGGVAQGRPPSANRCRRCGRRGSPNRRRGRGLDRYRSRPSTGGPAWTELSCATILVPLDYEKPNGEAISLAVARRVRPRRGGWAPCSSIRAGRADPGWSTSPTSTAPSWRTTTSSAGTLGGSAASTPVNCFGAADLDRLYAMDASPDDRAELLARIDAVQEFGRSCLERSGRLLEHISTVETVRDLDLLRGLVGDSKINYFGSSYGTRIGSLYAELYPERVGRMVLDGSVDISPKPPITQTEGFERALGHFAAWCASENCRLGESRDEVLLTIRGFLEGLDQKPMPLANGRVLTQQLGVEGVIYSMYGGERTWRPLADALVAAVRERQTRRSDGAGRSVQPAVARTAAMASSATPSRPCAAWTARTTACARLRSGTPRCPPMRRCSVRWADLTSTCALWPVPSAPKQPTDRRRGRAADRGDRHDRRPGNAVRVRRAHGRSASLSSTGDLQRRRSPCVRSERMRQPDRRQLSDGRPGARRPHHLLTHAP